MADNRRAGDIFGDSSNASSKTSGSNAKDYNSSPDSDVLNDINDTLNDILHNMGRTSQSAARSSMPGSKYDSNRWRSNRRTSHYSKNSQLGDFHSVVDEFTSGLEKSLLDSVGGSAFKDKVAGGLSNLAKQMNVEVSDLPNAFGKELGREFSNSKLGKSINDKVKSYTDKTMSSVSDAFKNGSNSKGFTDAVKTGFKSTRDNFSSSTKSSTSSSNPSSSHMQDSVVSDLKDKSADVAKDTLSKVIKMPVNPIEDIAGEAGSKLAGEGIASATGELGAAMEGGSSAILGLTSAAGAAAAALGPMIAIAIAVDMAFDTLAPAIDGTKKLFESMKAASNRYEESRKKNLELEKKRISDDFNTMVQAPFNILEDAAQNLYNAWDSQVHKITASQGYNKADVQDLMSAYANRLRSEGLTKVVSGSDIMQNLSTVLDSGLSGKVAEEFAYLATKLNAAVPTQDFFSYASTYASIAANAIQAGKSQTDAISYANSEMEKFASNVLFASRQLSGGFSTGLKDSQHLFESAVQIANASKIGDPGSISGVLTSVSAITGAVAPDLANSLVDAVVKAAVGGNSSDLVALRSLSGGNASNTEFLKALATDPKGVFTALFQNLSKMQNMSNDNYMEVAEGLSSVFGVSMDSLARVDFNYLANQISSMNVNNTSLDENMKLLASGQTTTSAEQMRMSQINQYMLDEGLSYVLDNEVARAIQEHMWQEQIAREMQEAQYAVNLQGAALDFLEGIKQTIDNISNFLNPFSWMKKLGNLIATNDQANALKADTRQMLMLGNVGKGNPRSLYNLSTTNSDLQLVRPITELMGGFSTYAQSKADMDTFNKWTNFSGMSSSDGLNRFIANASTNTKGANSPGSQYVWANVSKGAAASLFATPMNTTGYSGGGGGGGGTSNQDAVKARANSRFTKFLGTMDAAVAKHTSYDDWAGTAKQYGIANLSDALQDYGRSEAEIKGAFGNKEANEGSKYTHNRELVEDTFWAEATKFAMNKQDPWTTWENVLTTNQTTIIGLLQATNEYLYNKSDSLYNTQKSFLTEWTRYYVQHTAYSSATLNAYQAGGILKAEKKENGDAVLALAEALTANTVGIQQGFKDPVVQTNVLLAKLLIVAEAIMQQNNKTGGLSLPDSLASLAFGPTATK